MASRPWTSSVQKQVLPNHLTLLVERVPGASVIAVVTHVKAGYFDEPDEWVGIAHVLEHMFFKGTARRGPQDIARETQELGGYLNAATIYDKTVYYTVLPSAPGALAAALDIQSDALIHAALDAGELARELEVIIQEAKRKLDNPPAVAGETLYQLLFQVHRMRRWRIGTEDGLRRLTAGDLAAYYRSRYVPARTIVAITGDVDPDAALKLAQGRYGQWSAPAVPIPSSPPEPDGTRPVLRLLRGDVERSLSVLGWRTVPTMHPDTPALDLAAMVLGAGRGSWLSRAVRQPGFASTASASHYTPTDVGVFAVDLEGQVPRLDEAVPRVLETVRRLVDPGPDPSELARVRALFQSRWARGLEAVDDRATTLCEFEALGDYHLADQWYDRMLSVSAAEVRDVAGRYLGRESASAVMYVARDAVTGFDGGPWPPPPAGGVGDLTAFTAPPGPDRRPAPLPGTVRIGEVHHAAVAGADVLVQPKRGAGLVTVAIYFPGVRPMETPADAGSTWLLARAALRGAGGLTATELALAAESLGGSIGAGVVHDALGWSLTVPADAASAAASLLRSVALEPALEEEGFATERTLQALDAARARDDMMRHPIQRVLAMSFPGDVLGFPPLGEPEVVPGIERDLVSSRAAGLQRRRAVVVAVGDLDRDGLLQAVESLADWPGREGPADVPPPRFEPTRGAERRDRAQTALAMAFPGLPAASPRRHAATVLATLLSGLAGRLFHALREERALAYTVFASPWFARRAGSFLTYIATSPEREDEARAAMLAELERVAREPISEVELTRARNYAAGQVQLGRQTGRAVAGEILEAWLDGVLPELPELADRLRGVTEEMVVQEARGAFRPDQRAEYVVRGNPK